VLKSNGRKFASRGLNVVIIGTRDVARVAEEIATRFQVQTRAIQADLGVPIQVERVMKECRDLSVGLFCCNHASTHLQTHEQFRLWLDTSEEEI
jgi:short-subunit dehydrogenase